MRRVSLLGTSVFIVLLLGLIFSSLSLVGEKNVAANDNSGCPVVLLKNQEYFPALIKAIDEAKSEIIGSFFLFKAGHENSCPNIILEHLTQAAQKGVKVVIILENSGGYDHKLDAENQKIKKLLENKGVKIYFDEPRKTTHTKIIVIDQQLVLLGSHNLTQAALKYNNEISVLINRHDLAREARTYMLTLIKEAK